MRLFFFIMFFLISAGIGLSQPFTFSGQIFDEAGTPLAYTGVMTSDLSLGTLSDENGKFTLRLPDKRVYVFVFQYLGYKDLYDTIPVERNIVRNYRMQKEDLSTEEVIITSDGKDPAFGISPGPLRRKTGMQSLSASTVTPPIPKRSSDFPKVSGQIAFWGREWDWTLA